MPTQCMDIRQLPRACDRCHAVKERCDWPADDAQCVRCLRLGHCCKTIRRERRPGRKPGVRRHEHAHGTRERCPVQVATPSNFISTLGQDVSASDQQLVERFLAQNRLLDIFSVGSTFGNEVRRQVFPRLVLSRATLLDSFLVCVISWADNIEAFTRSRLGECFRHASSALATLASLEVTDIPTMADCLILGAMVSSFAMRLRLHDVLPIARRTLGLIEPMYTTASSNAQRQSVPGVLLSCVVMWELRACLFSCTMPTLRFRPPAEVYADRHVGLCATLLPLLYDICKLSHVIAHRPDMDASDVQDELLELECFNRQWQPTMPDEFDVHFGGTDVAHMLCQAQVMRLAMLLLIHRLQHPFGTNEGGVAQTLATAILTQLEMTFVATKQHVRCTDLPLLVACLELKGKERARWLIDIPAYAGFSPEYGSHVQAVLVSLWAGMDSSTLMTWCDMVKSGVPFLQGPL
ncbi:hypothetical protein PG987_014566 [Apiospora arundinis]